MSDPKNAIPVELQDLVAIACEGELSDQDTEQLEALLLDSPVARQYYLLYLHLHGELHWHEAMAGDLPDPTGSSGQGPRMPIPTPAITRPKPDRMSRLRLFGFCICALVVVGLLTLAYQAMPARKDIPAPPPPTPTALARMTGAILPRWKAGANPPVLGQEIPLDRRLVLERGVIEITHPQSTQVLIEGPAAFCYRPGGQIELEKGRLTVLGDEPADFTVNAGDATIVPTGGAIGIFADGKEIELHGLGGKAQIRRVLRQDDSLVEKETDLAGQGGWKWSSGSETDPQAIASDQGRFARALPPRDPDHSVARLREAVTNNARLIHHYTFEGTSRLEKCQDKRGAVHLTEAVMVDGRGRGSINYTAPGFDLTTDALGPHREPQGGNENGVALQSEGRFRPPEAMTIELLLRYQIPEDAGDETVALAVATRDGDRDCGFYVAAVGKGHLSLLLDGSANWVETDTVLAHDHWYYVAFTFKKLEESTVVNAYLADLTVGERQLRQVLKDEEVPGVPATSRLGIGKGFDNTIAHAYPWSGELDEIALYDAVLDPKDLQAHLDLLQAGEP